MDLSNYCNPAIPFGCNKKSPNMNYKEGLEIDGVVYTIVPCLFESGIFQLPDCTGLSDFELTDSDDTGKARKSNLIPANGTTDDSTDDEIDKIMKHRKRGKTSGATYISTDDEIGRVVKRRKKDKGNETSDDSSDNIMDRFMKYRKKGKINRTTDDESDRGFRHRKRERNYRQTSVFCSSVPRMRIKKEECCEKRKQIRIHEVHDCISDSSDQHNSPSRCKSPPPTFSPLQNNEVVLKDNSLQPPDQLFGYFFCEVCNLDMSSEKVYYDHMSGKRHRKNVKAKNVDQAVVQSMPAIAATEGESKYPRAPHGVRRRKVKQRAKIQDVIKNEVKKPCPGLHLVTEIQGLTETQYYCSICNAICSPNSIISHLIGFKHQLYSVKHFRPGDYEGLHNQNKSLIQGTIIRILRAIQRKEGLGRMTVEIEELISDDGKKICSSKEPSTSKGVGGRSLKDSGMSFHEYYDQATVPNKSSSDFYCSHCDSHMNSEDMWKAHIAGKRHITNLKKLPGDRPSKTKTVPLLNAKAKLLDRLEEECAGEPVLGLDEIREIQIKETNSESYQCFLCSSCHTALDIVEHILSFKHRQKYLTHINYPFMQYISGMSEASATPVIRDICAAVEADCGSGIPSVHINKSAFFG